jgi:hypothetical protein
MPYSIGEQGSYGCSGYPVISDYNGEIESMGCHATREEAEVQQALLTAAGNKSYKDKETDEGDKGIGIKDPEEMPASTKASPCWDGYVQRGMKPGENGGMVPNCVPVAKAIDIDLFSNFGKDYTKTTKEIHRVGE